MGNISWFVNNKGLLQKSTIIRHILIFYHLPTAPSIVSLRQWYEIQLSLSFVLVEMIYIYD